MYEAYYRLRTKPFTLVPDPEFLFLGTRHKMALNLLEYGLVNGSAFIVITGEPGTGKTTLLNQLLGQSSHQWTIGVLSNTHEALGGLMPWIMASFGLETKGKDEVQLFHEFGRFLELEHTAGRKVLLVLDEAQNVGAVMLEELRLLSNLNDGRRRALQILLSGQPGLRGLLEGPGMVQFAQRIGVEYTLDVLSEEETVAYIGHRLRVAGRHAPLFTALAGRTIFRLSGGTPRLINQLCDHALVYGYAAQADTITARIILDAAAARARHGVLPFMAHPGEIALSQAALDEEQAEVGTFQRDFVQSDGQAAHGNSAHMESPAESYRNAVALKQAGEYARALVLLEALTEEKEWAAKALVQKALCLNAAGRYDDALRVVQAALDRQSASSQESVSLRYLQARTLEAKGQYGEAVVVYRALERGRPGYRDVSVRLARLDRADRSERNVAEAGSTWLAAFWRGCGQLLRGTHG